MIHQVPGKLETLLETGLRQPVLSQQATSLTAKFLRSHKPASGVVSHRCRKHHILIAIDMQVHAYTAGPQGRTAYLSELHSGQEVIVVNSEGQQRSAIVGRVKIETRPLVCLLDGPPHTACTTFCLHCIVLKHSLTPAYACTMSTCESAAACAFSTDMAPLYGHSDE